MHSLTSALYGGEWPVSCPSNFTPWERAAGTHWIGGWVGPRACLDMVSKRKIPVNFKYLGISVITQSFHKMYFEMKFVSTKGKHIKSRMSETG
jgi:hypothetical protein